MSKFQIPQPESRQPKQCSSESATARTERQHRTPGADDATLLPGRVIPGESYPLMEFPESGERYEIFARGIHACFVAHPLPHPGVEGYTALTDYFNCTFPFQNTHQNVRTFLDNLLRLPGLNISHTKNRGKGFNGYERSYELGEFGAQFGYGGQAGTALLSLPGQACAAISDWMPLVELLRDQLGARITRWDGAVDDFEGTHPVDWAVERYMAGDFTNGGNKPSCRQAGNWIDPDGTGRTFYIGKRGNGKMLRVYEKGMQAGKSWHPWVRYEVELHNVDRTVPWDVIFNPGKYVAGAYPKALAWITEEMSRIRTIKEEGGLAYQHLVRCASNAYGPLVNVMLEVEGSPEAVVKKLRRPGVPSRLAYPIEKPLQG